MSQTQATFPFPLPAEPRTTAAASRIGSGRPGGGGEQVKEAAHLSHKLEACGGHSEGDCPDPPSRPGHPELIPAARPRKREHVAGCPPCPPLGDLVCLQWLTLHKSKGPYQQQSPSGQPAPPA